MKAKHLKIPFATNKANFFTNCEMVVVELTQVNELMVVIKKIYISSLLYEKEVDEFVSTVFGKLPLKGVRANWRAFPGINGWKPSHGLESRLMTSVEK